MHKKKKERTHAHTTSHLLHSYMMALTVSRRILCIFACVPESIYLWHNVISYILNISPTNGHPTYRKHYNYIITKAIKSIRAKRKKSLCYVLCNYLSVADSSEKSVCDTMIASCFCAKKKKRVLIKYISKWIITNIQRYWHSFLWKHAMATSIPKTPSILKLFDHIIKSICSHQDLHWLNFCLWILSMNDIMFLLCRWMFWKTFAEKRFFDIKTLTFLTTYWHSAWNMTILQKNTYFVLMYAYFTIQYQEKCLCNSDLCKSHLISQSLFSTMQSVPCQTADQRGDLETSPTQGIL